MSIDNELPIGSMLHERSFDDDPAIEFVGQLIKVKLEERSFTAKLIAVKPTEFWFVRKDGVKWMINRSEVLWIQPVKNQPPKVV